MKAIVQDGYGGPETLEFQDVPEPELTDDRVLVRVAAASLNPYDWHLMRGLPHFVRLQLGMARPKQTIRGVDFAGRVEKVGKDVEGVIPGDEVFGESNGALAELMSVSSRSLVSKPRNMTFEEAAAVPMGGLTALQALRDTAHTQAGDRVLINGSSGGVGTYAVQIAKALGAEVTAVCSTRNLEMVRSIGADHVVDYTKDDFTDTERRYEVIIDTVSTKELSECRRILEPDAVYVSLGALEMGNWIGPLTFLFGVKLASWRGSQRMVSMLARTDRDDLTTLKDMAEAGEIRSVIDRTYPLAEAAEAMRYLEEGHVRGKVVVTI